MEIERGLGLVDQRRDVADVDRLVQVDQLADLPQPVEELAEILLHRDGLRTRRELLAARRLGYLDRADSAIQAGEGTTLRQRR